MNSISASELSRQNRQTQPASNSPDLLRDRSIYVALPAYNEAVGLPSLLTKLNQTLQPLDFDFKIIVVDDASTDETASVTRQISSSMPIFLVQHQQNKGLSGALETGFRTALEMAVEGDIIVTMDADDTHMPATINRLLLKIEEGYDVVIASRYQPGSRVEGVPFSRVMMTAVARYMFKMAMPIKGVRDYTCGFRAYRYNVLKKGFDHYGDEFVSEKGFSCMVDVLLKLRRFGYIMGEVPMLLRYDQKHGPSKMQVGMTAFKTLRLLLKRRLSGY